MAAFFPALLDTVTAGARAAWPFVQAAVGEGLGANEILDALKSVGLGARRQDILALVREANVAELARSDLNKFLRSAVLPIDRIRTAVTKITSPFSYTIRYTLRDPDTGEISYRFRQAGSQQVMAPDVVLDTMGTMFGGEGSEPIPNVTDMQLWDVVKAGNLGVL